MPEMTYTVRWPDGSRSRCWSPSLVIRERFEPGVDMPLPEFLDRLRAATDIASERVRARYGFACSRAADQLQAIEHRAARFADLPRAHVRLLDFDPGDLP